MMPKNRFLVVFFLVSCILGSTASKPAYAELDLVFGIFDTERPRHVVKKYRPIFNELEKILSQELNEPVKIRTHLAPTHQKMTEQILGDAYDFMLVDPADYLLFKDNGKNCHLIVEEITEGKGERVSVIVSPHLTLPEELIGKRFLFGHEGTSMGHFLPQKWLLHYHISQKDLESYKYLSSDFRILRDLELKKADAGIIEMVTFKSLPENKFHKIAEIQGPAFMWISKQSVPAKIRNVVKKYLLEYRNEAVLKDLGVDRYDQIHETQLASLKEAIQINWLFFRSSLQGPTVPLIDPEPTPVNPEEAANPEGNVKPDETAKPEETVKPVEAVKPEETASPTKEENHEEKNIPHSNPH